MNSGKQLRRFRRCQRRLVIGVGSIFRRPLSITRWCTMSLCVESVMRSIRAESMYRSSMARAMSQVPKIISGGQTGADRAALDWALSHNVPCGGWCPKGREAEDGKIEAKYPLREPPSDSYLQRTEWNVRDSDATVVFSINPILSGGSKKTLEF